MNTAEKELTDAGPLQREAQAHVRGLDQPTLRWRS